MKIAEALLGSIVIHGNTSGRIIETEAYREVGDESCHLFYRKGAREFADRCQPGDAYIYLNYGVHWLLNVLTLDCETGHSGFVLIRALEPIQGIREMKQRRGKDRINELCSGPGKLTQALGIGPT
ncbi:MAG: DNA-3-methyladenine glycosylase, partial [Verrucomicrobiota bacterium]